MLFGISILLREFKLEWDVSFEKIHTENWSFLVVRLYLQCVFLIHRFREMLQTAWKESREVSTLTCVLIVTPVICLWLICMIAISFFRRQWRPYGFHQHHSAMNRVNSNKKIIRIRKCTLYINAYPYNSRNKQYLKNINIF